MPGRATSSSSARAGSTSASTLSLDVSGVTVRGQGPDKTILSFKDQGQGTGGEGLLVTSKDDVTLEDLAVEDARGDGIKANGTKRISSSATSAPSGPAAPRRPTAATESIPCSAPTC